MSPTPIGVPEMSSRSSLGSPSATTRATRPNDILFPSPPGRGEQDDEPFVHRLYADLQAAEFDVWFDRVNMPTRGLAFHQEIREAITHRDRLLRVVGPQAVNSEYVRQEWEYAWFDAEKVVTPILRLGDYPLAIPELVAGLCYRVATTANATHSKDAGGQPVNEAEHLWNGIPPFLVRFAGTGQWARPMGTWWAGTGIRRALAASRRRTPADRRACDY